MTFKVGTLFSFLGVALLALHLGGCGDNGDDTPEGCGNGLLDDGEVCDDGNAVGGDGCSADCLSEEYCGNGVVDTRVGEQCDDGNVVDGDGCSATCTTESEGVCGDGNLDAGEECDDGNTDDDDGCDSSCREEVTEGCGDGNLDEGEECDDGNTDDGDGCSATCTIEEDPPVCGDGTVEGDEQCDDGNTNDGDGCDSSCRLEATENCGDGNLDEGEECDDGNTDAGDGCGPSCRNEECGNSISDPGEVCDDGNTEDGDGCSADCSSNEECGNGIIDDVADEVCDDGNRRAGDGCSADCLSDETCGNDYLDPGEICDDGNRDSGDGCAGDCLSDESCGNGVLDAGEGCDDGNTDDDDGCSATCEVEVGESCGDGRLDPWEGCDDGGRTAGDGCDADCMLESCGDGDLDAGEGCDDDNDNDGDACPSTCRPAICGDTFLRAGVEECDDGNNLAGDGCSAVCRLEICGNGILDPGEGCDDANADNSDSCPECQPAECGDGHVHAGFEMCDDGNTTDGDGCSADCSSDESCGNGIIDDGELCDDGNDDDDDACPTSCEPAICGDGIVWTGHETCDDGNTVGGDGCSPDCVLDGCGSGTVEGGEECDEGGANGTPGSSCFENCISIDVAFSVPFEIEIDQGSYGNGPRGLETADFNADDRADLIVTNSLSDTATVLYGFGDGRFWAPFIRGTGSGPKAVRLADLDEDGLLDAVACNSSSNSVSVLLGDGLGLATATSFSIVVGVGGNQPNDLAIADLDGDGDLDVVTANNSSDNVTVMLGDGTGELTPTSLLSTREGSGGDGPYAIEIADVTNDGVLDVVTANQTSDDVTVIPGLGAGSFAPAEVYTTRVGAGGDSPQALVLADVTGDGLDDVITANTVSDDITVLVANGAGGLNAPVRVSTLGASGGDNPQGITVADVDEDGQPDIITANNSDDITILAGVAGGATFEAPIVISVAPGDGPVGVAVADMNDDGIPDILTSNTVSDDITILIGEGSGSFASPAVYESRPGYNGDNPRSLAVGDINGDGALDVVTANNNHANLSVVAGFGDGLLAPSQTVSVYDQPRGVDTADLNGDGVTDWALVTWGGEYLQRGLQNSSGQFSVAAYYPFDGWYGDSPPALALGDLNHDDDIDVVTATEYDDGCVVMQNNGTGNFSVYDFYSLADAIAHIALADVTGSGNLDVVAVSPTAHQVIIRPGTGSTSLSGASFLDTDVSTSGRGPRWVTVADVNDDLFPDILTANSTSNDTTLLLGLGSGSFDSPIIVPATFDAAAAEVSCVRVGHFNDDDILDIATANRARNTVSVMLGFGDGSYAAPQSFDVGGSPYVIAVDDFDGDGIDDIAAANYDDDTITILRGLGHP